MSVVAWCMLKPDQCRATALRGGGVAGLVGTGFVFNKFSHHRYGVVDTVPVSTGVSYRS